MGFLQRVWEGFKGKKAPSIPPPFPGNFDVHALEQNLHYTIRNPQLFRQALLHRSYLQVLGERSVVSNERLEFLGDSILNLVVGEYVYHRYPEAEEGELTKIRSRLVNRKVLAMYARQLNLWDFMLLSTSASQSVGKGSETILADAFEALIAAVYLDGGYPEAQKFVQRQIFTALDRGLVSTQDENFKSRLLELAQANGLEIPRYVLLHEDGPDHDRTFTIEVRVGKSVSGIGVGKNKKDAEQAAAEQALENIGDVQ